MGNENVEFILKARDEASAAIARVAGATTDLRGAFAGLASKAGVFGVVATGALAAAGAIVAATASLSDQNEAMSRVAQAAGTTVQNVQLARASFDSMGLSAEQADKSLSLMAKAIGNNNPTLKSLGVTSRDAYGALVQMSNAMRKGGDAADHMRIATNVLGKSGTEVAGVLKQFASQADAMHSVLRRTGGVISDELSGKLADFDTAIDQLGLTWQGLWNNMVGQTVTAATKIITVTTALIQGQYDLVVAVDTARRFLAFEGVSFGELAATYQRVIIDVAKATAAIAGTVRGATELAGGGKRTGGDGDSGTARAARISEIARLLRVSRGEAERLLVKLEAIEDAKKAADILETLRSAEVRVTGGDGPDMGGGDAMRSLLEETDKLNRAAVERQLAGLSPKQVIDSAARARLELAVVRLEWESFAMDMLKAPALMNLGFETLWSGMGSGFQRVADEIRAGTLTLGSFWDATWDAMSREALAALARVAQAKLFTFVLGLFTGPIGLGIGTTADALTRAGAPRAEALRGFDAGRSSALGARPIINVNVASWSTRDGVMQLTNPGSELFQALDRMAYGGAG